MEFLAKNPTKVNDLFSPSPTRRGGGTLEVLQILITLGLLEIYLSLLTVTTLIMDNITITLLCKFLNVGLISKKIRVGTFN